jgi:UDP-glucose 4-epimerase
VRCRFFNSYGPGEIPGPYRNVIPNFIWRALCNEPLMITGTGAETRDFIYVEDLVDGLVRAARTPAAAGLALNLGTGVQTRINDLARMVIETCGSRSEIHYTARRSWDKSTHRQADIRLAHDTLDFRPVAPVRKGIEQTVEWYRGNLQQIESELATEPNLRASA